IVNHTTVARRCRFIRSRHGCSRITEGAARMTTNMNKITVITPESFNEFLSEALDAVSIDELGHLEVTEVLDDGVVGIKVYAPGQWCTVQTELVEVEVAEEEEEWS